MNLYTKWAGQKHTEKQRILALIPAFFLFVLIIPYLLVISLPRLDASLGLPSFYKGPVNIIGGCLLMVLGAIPAFWSIYAQFTRADGTPLPMLPTKKLLISGPFRLCRNPMTLGTILVYLGVGIIVGSQSAVVAVLLFGGSLLTYIKLVEEKELEARFGAEYVAYKAATPFIIPRIHTKKNNRG